MQNDSSNVNQNTSELKPLEISSDPRGFILMKISGPLSGDAIAQSLTTTIQDAEKVLADTYRKDGKKLKILMDISQFSGDYDSKTVEIMTRFAQENTPYVERTAGFGDSEKGRAAAEIITALAYRNNIRFFRTEAEALEWLKQ